MDSVAALKCNSYKFESSLAGHFDKASAHWRSRTGIKIITIIIDLAPIGATA